MIRGVFSKIPGLLSTQIFLEKGNERVAWCWWFPGVGGWVGIHVFAILSSFYLTVSGGPGRDASCLGSLGDFLIDHADWKGKQGKKPNPHHKLSTMAWKVPP